MTLEDKDLKWLGIDFDETIAEHSGLPDFKLLNPVRGAKRYLNQLNNAGWKIIIHTARPWSEYELVERWLNKNGIPFRRIVCGKLLAKYYIDDRAIAFDGDWASVVNKIV